MARRAKLKEASKSKEATMKSTSTPLAGIMSQSQTRLKKVLVVGDWLVDEHWIVGRHRSESASRAGRRHSRALNTSDSSVRSLCGAGQVATILHCAHSGDEKLFEVLGLGLWHEGDEEELRYMIEPRNNIANAPYRLLPITRDRMQSLPVLMNLASGELGDQVGTTRIIRIYEQQQHRIEIKDRVDWELVLSNSASKTLSDHAESVIANISSPEEIRAVIVKDLCKGVITSKVVASLARRFPAARWYVSSKAWLPDWYEELPSERVKLILIPQLAAQRAIRQRKISSTWLTIGKSGSKEALIELESLSRRFRNAVIAILPDGMKLLARDSQGATEPKGYRQTSGGDIKITSIVPMASVFFPALVTYLEYSTNRASLQNVLTEALSYTESWMREEYRRLAEDNWRPGDKQNLDIKMPYQSGVELQQPFGWEPSVRHWEQATSGFGIVEYREQGRKKLQLWRAMSEVHGYISCIPSKRDVLRTLLEQGRQFIQDRSRPTALMLMDAPGSGKSYLVGCLARQLGARFLQFNVTQMLGREDLLRSFDKIVTSQAEAPDEALVVFVDEINARLGGQHVYDAFLAPLEEGVYVRGGNTFHIAPCFWIFAGTRPPSINSHGQQQETDKGSDFESRLTMPPLKLNINHADPHIADAVRLEKIYIGAATIHRVFPDVRHVGTDILRAIDILPADIAPREIAQFVKRFRNVQYGKVASRNLPIGWNHDFRVDARRFEEWVDGCAKGDDDEIVLESDPESGLRGSENLRVNLERKRGRGLARLVT
jgi:predicted AAA+ superfamily ATPase